MQSRAVLLRFCSVTSVLAALLAFPCTVALAGHVDLGGDPLEIRLLKDDDDHSILEMTLGQFDTQTVSIDGQCWNAILLRGGYPVMEAGMPDLPSSGRNLVIPDNAAMALKITSESHVDLPNMPVAPSRGMISMNVDPDQIPYSFAPFYRDGKAYPTQPAECGEPFIIRDFRGITVRFHPFQYFPQSRTLRVYTYLRVEVMADGPSSENALFRSGPPSALDRQFSTIYQHFFLNFQTQRYDPLPEGGELLIVCHDSFTGPGSSISDFVRWKVSRGISTTLVKLSDIPHQGDSPDTNEIKDYI